MSRLLVVNPAHRLPALDRFYRETFAIKVYPLILESQNQTKNIPSFSRVPQLKHKAKLSLGS